MNQPQVYMCPPSWTLSHLPPHPIPLDCPSAEALSALIHASNLYWSSVSHMVIYMFQCYSLKSSHPRLLPQSSKVCSLCPCLSCCLAHDMLLYNLFIKFAECVLSNYVKDQSTKYCIPFIYIHQLLALHIIFIF